MKILRFTRRIQHHLFVVAHNQNTALSHFLLELMKEREQFIYLGTAVYRISKVDQPVAGLVKFQFVQKLLAFV